MSNFIFNAAAAALTAATLDLSTGSYYAHLVTTTPLLTDSTVSNLVVSTASGYAPTTLTGLSDNSQRWTFDSFTFPRYIFAVTPPVGVVICKRAGASPANSDQIICYSDFLNSIGQVILTPVGAYLISLAFGTSGAINKTYRYQYSSGVFVSTSPNGIIDLLGTSNGTIAFVNPVPGKLTCLTSAGSSNIVTFTNKIINSGFSASLQNIAFDFGARTVRVGQFGYKQVTPFSGVTTIYGSNNLPAWDQPTLADNGYWTALSTVTAATNNDPANSWILAPVTSTQYWRYLKMGITTGQNIAEIELFNSSILSPNQNLV